MTNKLDLSVNALQKGVTNTGYSFHLSEAVEAVFTDLETVDIFTALTGATFLDHANDLFEGDRASTSFSLPEVKAKTDNGPSQIAEGANQLSWKIGSFGTSGQVMKADWKGRRKVGSLTAEPMTEADALSNLFVQIQRGWDSHTELGCATGIVKDTNLLSIAGASGIYPSYDYSLKVTGASRSAITCDFTSFTSDIDARFFFSRIRKEIQVSMSKLGLNSNDMIVACSDSFFQERYNSEVQLEVARDVYKTGLDLGGSSIPQLNISGFMFDNFKSADGFHYINVGSSILAGAPMIPEGEAVAFPRMDGLMVVDYTGTARRGFNDEVPQNIYTFAKEGEYGIEVVTESNRLYRLAYPEVVRTLKLATP